MKGRAYSGTTLVGEGWYWETYRAGRFSTGQAHLNVLTGAEVTSVTVVLVKITGAEYVDMVESEHYTHVFTCAAP